MRVFLRQLREWAESDEAVAAVGLVGSHARGDARPDSDVDLVVLCSSPAQLLENHGWTTRFGVVKAAEVEDWGRVTSLRVWYENGPEAEFGLANPDWATNPDDGTRRVVSDGVRVLWDPSGESEASIRENRVRLGLAGHVHKRPIREGAREIEEELDETRARELAFNLKLRALPTDLRSSAAARVGYHASRHPERAG